MPIDWSLYVPVICVQTDSRYDGQSYMEPVRNVVKLNGCSVSRADSLTRKDFKTRDRKFEGVVDFTKEKETIEQAEWYWGIHNKSCSF